MVESEAKMLSEDVMLGAVMFGHEQMQVAIDAINELAAEVGKPAWDWAAPEENEALALPLPAGRREFADRRLPDFRQGRAPGRCRRRRNPLPSSRWPATRTAGIQPEEVYGALSKLEKNIVRSRVIAGEPRIDGRDTKTVRPIDVTSAFAAAHARFGAVHRGETQAIVATTLGTGRDAQIIDAIEGRAERAVHAALQLPAVLRRRDRPFVGSRSAARSATASWPRRGVQAVMPDMDDFPYVIRVVSEITESNGSSSMASVCGTSLR